MKLKKLISPIICLVLFVTALPAGAANESKPSAKSVITAMRIANDYFMNKWPDPGQAIPYPSRKKNYESNLWTRGCYFEGLMDLYEVDATIVTWGQILHDAMKGSAVLSGLWWWIIPPGILIAILGMSFAFLGFALDKILHPKLKSR